MGSATNPCASSPDDLITLRDVNIAEGACTAAPAVLSPSWAPLALRDATVELAAYTGGSGQVVVSAADDGDPATLANGSIRIAGDIDGDDSSTTSELEVLLVVSGCHIIIDGPCVYDTDPGTGVVTPADPASEQRCSEPDPADAVPDTKHPLPISLRNVVLVAAGGVWAADLQPVGCSYTANELTITGSTITGSTITGHAGATSYLEDCDSDPLNGREAVTAGYERRSSLPADTDQWATADIEWWPGREAGIWRRR